MISRNMSEAFYLPEMFRAVREAEDFESVTKMGNVLMVSRLLIPSRACSFPQWSWCC